MSVVVRPKEDQNIWNFFFSVLFALFLYFAIRIICGVYSQFPTSIPLFDSVIIPLAIFRLTRLIVYDKITRFFREWFVQKKEIKRPEGSVMVELIPYERGILRTIHDLLQCPWCIGVWVSLAVVFAYFVYPWAWLVIAILAFAGVASFIQVTVNLIGWKAELGKLQAHEISHGEAGKC